MHDTWNPWHGCRRVSEGCDNCFMMHRDASWGVDGEVIRRVAPAGFTYPLSVDRNGAYKVRAGEMLRVCMTSDFFLRQADPWREEAWDVIRARPDVKFFLLTKRPHRVARCLPGDWGDGWDNVMLSVSVENQRRADQRMPVLLDLPFAHKGAMAAPLIGPLDVAPYLADGQVEQILVGGENYGGTRPLDIDWVRSLRAQCEAADVSMTFIETGSVLVKDGRTYRMGSKRHQSVQAHRSGLSYQARARRPWHLRAPLGWEIPAGELHVPEFSGDCLTCGSRPICNGLYQGRCA
ncbi:Protein of unknown function DUF5131 [Propionibacterium ruminifibrarum]|uniref:Protein gp37 n=1 Tax=Propionibacterium ruminifibrarum TaxID=1962131 RepID=A0A375I1S4_9ACTN|nr:DUF5131 family protein [Propionibacterium ruminifibrarum]SPF68597.1 Protein of unknown function DUF5131 [Propionibacterium ruminifibrarum]